MLDFYKKLWYDCIGFDVVHKEVITTKELLLDGKYSIIRKLGQGAYGEVFLTLHTTLGVYRAVKRIHKGQDRLRTGRNEVDILKTLFHPSLPIIYDIDEDDVYFYIVEEYIEGPSLTDYIHAKKALSEKEAVGYAMNICIALEYMQESGGICHLDIKPDNIIVTNNGVRLLDFGSSLFSGASSKFITGTRGYAAPEMYTDMKPDVRCDIYAVGMLLGYMLTGRHIFSGTKKQSFCSEELSFIIRKCTSLEREDRYSSPGDLFLALQKSQTLFATTKNPYLICIMGSLRRIGTSHLCVMVASHFRFHKEKVLLILCDKEKRGISGLPLYEHTRRVLRKCGLYNADGIDILPSYDQYAEVLDENGIGKYDVVVKDLGFIEDYNEEQIKQINADTLILVGGHTMAEELAFSKAANHIKKCGKNCTGAFNFTDGYGYGQLRKESGNLFESAFRIPYCVNPYAFKDRSRFFEKNIIKDTTHCCHRSRRSRIRLRGNSFLHRHG